jgi:serine/threonine protein kinase
MAGGGLVGAHAFISYVSEDSAEVDRLQAFLESNGIPTWRDKDDLWPGQDWRRRIAEAITQDALVFVACFSRRSAARRETYQYEELILAVEELRKRSPSDAWLIPVRLSDCEIPDIEIDQARTLRRLQRVDLFGPDRDREAGRLVEAIHQLAGTSREDRQAATAEDNSRQTRRERPRERETRRERDDSYVSVVLPPALASRFELLGELPAQGREATLLLARMRETREQVVVKLYRRGISLEPGALEILRLSGQSPDGWQVVRLHEYGEEEGFWYEIQEHCPLGSLSDLMLDVDIDANDLIAKLAPTLEHLEGRVFHRDLKPANILVRRRDPLELAIGDFGLALDAELGSIRWVEGGTRAYQPPEATRNRVTAAWDWWSFGMIVAEVALRRHPLSDAAGTLPPEAAIADLIQDGPIDLSMIADASIRHLTEGLLQQDPEQRWGARQVAAWRSGRAPDVPSVRISTTRPNGRAVTIRYPAGLLHTDPASLAAALQDHWTHARGWLFEDKAPAGWRENLIGFLRSHECLDAADLVDRGAAAAPNDHAAMAFMLLGMDDHLRPVFNGVSVTRDGLHRTASEAIGDSGAAPRLEEVRTSGVLTLWQSLPDMVDTAEIDRDWQDGCRRVDELLYEVQYGLLYEPGRRGDELRSAAMRANSWLLLCALERTGRDAGNLRVALEKARTSPARMIPWWRYLAEQGEESDAALPAAVLAAVTERYARYSIDEEVRRNQDRRVR